MKINNRIFPHPILSNETDDYINHNFIVKIIENENNGNYHFDIKININNDLIKEKIEKGYIDIVIHVECPQTSFRQIYNFKNKYESSFEIEKDKLNKTVDICSMLIAADTLMIDDSFGLNNDYKGLSFETYKGYILGYCNDSVIITKTSDDLYNPMSIISIVKNENEIENGNDSMVVLVDGDKIKIKLNKKAFNDYNLIQNIDPSIIHELIALPAFIIAFDKIKYDEIDYKEYNWYVAIKDNLKSKGYEIDDDTRSSLELAQILLDYPLDKALVALKSIGGDES